MKITKTASGKTEIRISRSEWEAIGKKAGWAQFDPIREVEEVRSLIHNSDPSKINAEILDDVAMYLGLEYGETQAEKLLQKNGIEYSDARAIIRYIQSYL